MRKIVIATPIRTGVGSNFLAGLIPTLMANIPDVELVPLLMEGPAVNFARNDLTHYARQISAREIVFVDDDMGWKVEYFKRLISHVDIDVVGMLYCKRRPGRPAWLVNLKDGCEIDPTTGLCEVQDIATGFMKIRLDTVMPAIEKKFPHLEYESTITNGELVTSWEMFPMGCDGPRTPAARMERVKNILRETAKRGITVAHEQRLFDSVFDACYDEQPPSILRGEDYGFCRMARECGFKVYADFGAPIVPHIGDVSYPITPGMVGMDTEYLMPREMNPDGTVKV